MATASMQTKRKERTEQFRNHGGPGGCSFSQELVGSAFALLALGLEERTKRVWRERQNHYTRHAPGALVLIVSAFDAWMTESAVGVDPWDADLRRVGERPICERYAALLAMHSARPPPHESDLRAVVDARDEIVHYLPRTLPNRALPSWIAALDARGLLIRSPHAGADFTLSQKLSSYALAHWAFTTVAMCVASLVNATPSEKVPFAGGVTGQNFWTIEHFPDLHELPEFDRIRCLADV